jgi:hypothetical protein
LMPRATCATSGCGFQKYSSFFHSGPLPSTRTLVRYPHRTFTEHRRLLQIAPSILNLGRQGCLATGGAEGAQLHKPNRLWQPGRLAGHTPDTRRTLAVDNFGTAGGSSSFRRAS